MRRRKRGARRGPWHHCTLLFILDFVGLLPLGQPDSHTDRWVFHPGLESCFYSDYRQLSALIRRDGGDLEVEPPKRVDE